MIIDAENLIVGRMATYAAKRALLGESVDIVNCEKAVITGSKKNVFAKYKQKANRGGPFKGPFIPKLPDRFVRRIVRGMLPYKQEKGKSAFKRIMCYNSIPEELKGKKMEKLREADISRIKTLKYTTIKNICESLKATKDG